MSAGFIGDGPYGTLGYPGLLRQGAGSRPLARLNELVVGDGNRVAVKAAEMVVRALGEMSPLFIHGPHGVGKTHLLEGILAHVRAKSPTSFVSSTRGGPPAELGAAASIVYFRVDDIASACRVLRTRGVELEGEPHVAHRAPDHELWLAFFRDPDRNLLALMSENRGV